MYYNLINNTKIKIVKYNKNITGFPNLKGMHISFIASNKYKSSCKDSLETITTNLFNNKLESTCLPNSLYNKINYSIYIMFKNNIREWYSKLG